MTDPIEPFPDEPADTSADALREWARREARRRLVRTEAALEESTHLEREALGDWLGGMLHRPPLERPTPAYRPMRALIDALWWDIADRTADPLEPLALAPALIDNHPWGEGADS